VVKKLRQRAKRNQRSLQGELLVIINEAAIDRAPAPPAMLERVRSGTKTIEQIFEEHRARHPEPVAEGPYAVDIIRAERDAR
jgi:hypothetical protein